MSKFGNAFSAARKAGKKEFTYNGKRYNTRTKDDEAKSSKKNTAAVSKGLDKKIAARAKTPNTTVKVTAKAPAKPKPKAKTKPSAGDTYKRMAAAGKVPGKKGPASRNVGKPAAKAKAKPKARGIGRMAAARRRSARK